MTHNTLQTVVDTSIHGLAVIPCPDTGELIAGRYQIIRPLGGGGMGSVYLAEDLQLARQVAIKTIRPDLINNDEVHARIKREYRMQAAIGVHPHIITLYDSIEEHGHIYLIMEYFAGETLARYLANSTGSRSLPLHQTLDIIRQLLQALACIHSRDIVHRDIKTSNILLQMQSDGRLLVKLTDFGIALLEDGRDDLTRLTSFAAQGPGTPVYMAPERIDPQRFGDISPATDLYAAGIILFELLTGGPPFKGSMTEVFSGHLTQSPALEELESHHPAEMEQVLRKALAKHPADRFQNAASFLEVLATLDTTNTPTPSLVSAGEEVTLLAPIGSAPEFSQEATVLAPAVNRGPIFPALRRTWIYLAAVLLGLLVGGYLLHGRFTTKPVSPAAPAVESTAAPRPLPVQKPAEPTEEKNTSALQAADNNRQPKNAAPMAPATRNAPDKSGQEWQVIESHTRKIH